VVKLRALAGATQAWFQTLVGQPDAGEAVARIAAEMLQDSPDLDGYITAAQCRAVSLAYLGRMEEMAECMDAAMAVADAAPSSLLVCRDAELASLRRGAVGRHRNRVEAPPRGV